MIFKEEHKSRLIEQISRMIAQSRGENPDEMVSFQQPYIRPTGGMSLHGLHFAPAWSVYIPAAIRMLQYIQNREWDNVTS